MPELRPHPASRRDVAIYVLSGGWVRTVARGRYSPGVAAQAVVLP